MQAVRWLLVCCVMVLFVAPSFAQDKATDLIVGKWETKEKRGDQEITASVEFSKDNKLKIAFGPVNIDGTYKVLSDSELELEMSFMNESRKEKTKFKVTKDSLEFTNKDGKVTKFTKAK